MRNIILSGKVSGFWESHYGNDTSAHGTGGGRGTLGKSETPANFRAQIDALIQKWRL